MHDRPQTSSPTGTPRKRRRLPRAVTAVAVLGAIMAAGTPAFSGTFQNEVREGLRTGGVLETGRPDDAVQRGAEGLVRDGFPGVLAAVRGAGGRTRDYTAGVGDKATGRKPPVNGRVRAASNTKPFVAAVVLQLVAEGKVKLDAPIETYLPGLVRGQGIDAKRITVRQVLQHTSGLPEYSNRLNPNAFEIRDVYMEPRELLDIALKHKADFAPGTRWRYSNTNYVVAGLLVQKVTGRPVGEEITQRIIRPLGLRDTYWPGVGDRTIRGPHPKGYDAPKPGAPLGDITRLDPSWGWAAGQLISSPRDLNRFFAALIGGRLLRPAELKAMMTTVRTEGSLPDSSYGLGLFKSPLTCGGELWGHGGDINGYETRGGVTKDGRAVTVAVTALPGAIAETEADMEKVHQHVLDLVDTAICK
ncbi:serine hydrolase domain-containing protein [Actinomadura viridis]|uniref:D-alanyl-D-alanine carboxypeptidase n=1 Tax=Actinomadura viridis TaxID=58110 RepID=A0A931DUL5_9ACTN|nr:serine hydrolase domain-containing protein [Actinomadura viridis]MBG6092993.1 D-alanyl-D-alanine carboxypeptidase [Actinomadura viridis]